MPEPLDIPYATSYVGHMTSIAPAELRIEGPGGEILATLPGDLDVDLGSMLATFIPTDEAVRKSGSWAPAIAPPFTCVRIYVYSPDALEWTTDSVAKAVRPGDEFTVNLT